MQQLRFAKKLERLASEGAFEVLAKAKELEKQGKEIIHLEIGEPDFDTPKNIKDAAKKALDDGYTHYTPSAGIIEVREKVAEYVSKTNNMELKKENINMTPGVKTAIFLSLLAIIDDGDEIILPSPGYPTYASMTNFMGAKTIQLPLIEEKDYRFDVEELKELITPKTKAIIINSPQNPTGGILEKSDLKAINDLSADHNLFVVSDEIYSRMVYSGKHESMLDSNNLDRVILIDGHSKTFAMTGWRLGYTVTSEELAKKITRLMVNSCSCACAFTQVAGVEALFGPQDEVNKMIEVFKERRKIFVDGLNKIDGFKCRMPKGAFYAFPNIKELPYNDDALADKLLHEAGVACLNGSCFGEYGKGHLRFSYANSIENLQKALEKIKETVEKL